MGWLEGVLTGYADRHYQIQRDKMRQAELAAEREGKVFETLLNSPYQNIKDYALAGILDLSNPRRRKGGVAGWMGEIEQTPYLDMIKRARERIGSGDREYAEENLLDAEYPALGQQGPEQGGTAPPTPSIPSPSGSVAGTGSAAQVSTSPVTGGPVTPPTPAPPPPRPPDVSGALPQRPPEASFAPGAQPGPAASSPSVSFAPPAPPPSVAGQTGSGLSGATVASVGTMPPVPPARTQLDRPRPRPLPGIIPTTTEAALDAARARSAGTDLGEQDSYIRVAEAQGLTRAEGLQMWAEAQMKARGGAAAATPYAWRTMEYTDAGGAKRRILARTNRTTGAIEDVNGNPLPAGATPVTPGLYPAEVAARRQAQNALLWNQALTQARSVLGVNATPEEVIDFADQLFTQSQSMAPQPPQGPGGVTPVVPPVTPPVTQPVTPPVTQPVTPVTPPITPPVVPPVTPPVTPKSPGTTLKEGLTDAGNADLLDRRRDEGRPATTQERDYFGFYLRSRQALDAIMAPDKATGLSLEERLIRQPLGEQFARRLTPDLLDFMLGADAQLYKTAAERFTEARVRRVSGAAIRPDEFENDRKLFFAQPGDTPERLAEKQRLREAEMDANVFVAGPAYTEYFKRPYVPQYMQQNPNATRRLPDPMAPPPPNRSVPRAPGGLAPSHAPQSAAPPPATPTGTPTSVKGSDGKWYIVFE